MSDWRIKQKNLTAKIVTHYIETYIKIWIHSGIIGIITQFHGIYINTIFESNILDMKTKASFMELICNQLKDNIRIKRLYSGLNDGFRSSMFHSLCDDKSPTICVIHNEFNTIFGGYTQVGWTQEWKCFHDKSAFLYQLFPNKRVILQKRDDGHKAVFHKKPYMCGFSGQCDLVIKDECHKRANSYVFPRHYQFNDPTMLCGGRNINKNAESSDDSWENDQMHFLVKDIEVFQVIS